MALNLTLAVGNSASRLDDSSWSWSTYLRAGRHARLIDRVVFYLHETFRNPSVEVEEPDVTGSFRLPPHQGWGVFEVVIEVYWKSASVATPTTSRFVHMLVFDGDGAESEQIVAISMCAPRQRQQPADPEPSIDETEAVGLEARMSAPQWTREEVVERLGATAFLDREDPRFFHGRVCGVDLPRPDAVWTSTQKPREGSADWLTATEFQDSPEALQAKVGMLATLLLLSQKTVAYTGAGISVAAGIGQAAVGTAVGTKTVNADPTLTHHTMAALSANGWLSGWVQQNHDGLPQKAGYPQECINEIHGSWFDPSNPVVLYSGTLRDELCENMVLLANTSDLTLVMGTSLTGLNADQVAKTPAKKSLKRASLGTVIISPQQTEQDSKATLRIFAKSDDVMRMLAKTLGLRVRRAPKAYDGPLRVAVPYDSRGAKSDRARTFWNLEPGQKVRVVEHNNIQGAGQPSFKHITTSTVGEVLQRDDRCSSLVIAFGSARVRLGLWWLEAAQRGAMDWLPLINDQAEHC